MATHPLCALYNSIGPLYRLVRVICAAAGEIEPPQKTKTGKIMHLLSGAETGRTALRAAALTQRGLRTPLTNRAIYATLL